MADIVAVKMDPRLKQHVDDVLLLFYQLLPFLRTAAFDLEADNNSKRSSPCPPQKVYWLPCTDRP